MHVLAAGSDSAGLMFRDQGLLNACDVDGPASFELQELDL